MTRDSQGSERKLTFTYFHPVIGCDGKRLSTANIIWADRDRGSPYYRTSKFAMNAGRFPANHPCAPFDEDERTRIDSQLGQSPQLRAFRSRGYWASCFPEGDGITLKWWQDVSEPTDKTAAQVMQDIRECFGWEIEAGGTQ